MNKASKLPPLGLLLLSLVLPCLFSPQPGAAALPNRAAALGNPTVPALVLLTGADPEHLLLRLLLSLQLSTDQLILACEQPTCPDTVLQVQQAQHLNEHLALAAVSSMIITAPLHVIQAWNQALLRYPRVPWFLFLEFDAVLRPGQLSHLVSRFTLGNLDFATLSSPGAHSYQVFCLRQSLWQQLGPFEEKVLPVAGATSDWEARLKLRRPDGSYPRTGSFGSMPTLAEDRQPQFWLNSSSLRDHNLRYIDAKWGCKQGSGCSFTRSFNGDSAAGNRSLRALQTSYPEWYKLAAEAADETGQRGPLFLHPPLTLNRTASRYIPVLATSVVADPHMFLLRLFHSIDFPVGAYVITADLSDVVVTAEVRSIQRAFLNVTVIDRARPGVSESWNQAYRHHPSAEWFVYVAYDCMFGAGQLSRLHKQVASMPKLEFAMLGLRNSGDGGCGFNVMVYTARMVNRIGMFDENIWPAYNEDVEWGLRMRRAVPPVTERCFYSITYWHGLASDRTYVSGIRRQQKNDHIPDKAMDVWGRINEMNVLYVRAKWGCEGHGWTDEQCKYQLPFNGKPINYWTLNTSRLEVLKALVTERDAAFKVAKVPVVHAPPPLPPPQKLSLLDNIRSAIGVRVS